MTEQTDAAEVVELLRIVREAYIYAIPTHSVVGVPERILASDWLAAREAAAEARGAERALREAAEEIEAERDAMREMARKIGLPWSDLNRAKSAGYGEAAGIVRARAAAARGGAR